MSPLEDRRMSAKGVVTGIAIWIAVFFGLLLLMIIITGVGAFVAPTMVPGWKAQGLNEAPFAWQLMVDISDFCIHRWIAALLILVGASLVVSKAIASKVGGDRSA
jgi:hypothetical protein